jgi:hypothetical protein
VIFSLYWLVHCSFYLLKGLFYIVLNGKNRTIIEIEKKRKYNNNSDIERIGSHPLFSYWFYLTLNLYPLISTQIITQQNFSPSHCPAKLAVVTMYPLPNWVLGFPLSASLLSTYFSDMRFSIQVKQSRINNLKQLN